jgi:GT2 family glycosyltransferase
MLPELAIVVLAWNQRSLTLDCLDSLVRVNYPAGQLRIIVVDNGSIDNTVDAIRSGFPAVTVIENGENLGYAGGNNIGIRHALALGAEYVCVLNNDVAVRPDFLVPLVDALKKNDDVGLVTPLVAEMSHPDHVWALGGAVDGGTGEVSRLHAHEQVRDWHMRLSFAVDVASGAAMLAKHQVFERAGLLDESFYLYYEEIDWCLRVRRAGYRILAVPSSVVWHKVSATLGQTSPVIDYYMLRNHLRLIARHWSGASRLRLLTRTVVHNLVTIAAYTAKPHGRNRLPHRDARLLALRDAVQGRWGKMGPDVEAACCVDGQ